MFDEAHVKSALACGFQLDRCLHIDPRRAETRGAVYLARNSDEAAVVLKFIGCKDRDADFASALASPAFAPVLATHRHGDLLFLVSPYYPDGDLWSVWSDAPRLDEGTALEITAQVLRAVAHAHTVGVCMRDLSLENILLSGDVVLLCDYGQCVWGGESAGLAGKRFYRAPEVSSRSTCDARQADAYQCGVILALLLAPRADRPDLCRLLECNVSGSSAISDLLTRLAISAPVVALVAALTQFDPTRRVSVSLALQFECLTSVAGNVRLRLCPSVDSVQFRLDKGLAEIEATTSNMAECLGMPGERDTIEGFLRDYDLPLCPPR